MAYFEWADDLAIDHGVVDADHKNLVDTVNALHTATSAGRGSEIVADLLRNLLRDTLDHIRREEDLMQRTGYPHLTEHRHQHQLFVDRLNELQAQLNEGRITVAAQLSSALRDWLSLHIRRDDKKLYYHLAQQAPKAKLSPASKPLHESHPQPHALAPPLAG